MDNLDTYNKHILTFLESRVKDKLSPERFIKYDGDLTEEVINEIVEDALGEVIEAMSNYLDGAPPDSLEFHQHLKFLIKRLKLPKRKEKSFYIACMSRYFSYNVIQRAEIDSWVLFHVRFFYVESYSRSRFDYTKEQRTASNIANKRMLRNYFKSSPDKGGFGMIVPKAAKKRPNKFKKKKKKK